MKKDETTYKHLIDRMMADDSVDAPVDAIKFVKNYYRSHAVEQPSTFRRIMAVLSLDLAAGQMALGERSGSTATPRQVLFDAGEHAIDLRVSIGHGARVSGQILGYGFENGTIEIGDYTAKIDDQGRFNFDQIATGEYDILVKGDRIELVVKGFTIE